MKPDFDVLIVGAGISGVGAAAHLERSLPEKSYAILEGRDSFGGTWDLFRYPGIRSDSDLHTFCYSFKPWLARESIAAGPAIMDYLAETIEEYRLADRIRFRTWVRAARWSTEDACWTVLADGPDGEDVELTARWLFCAGGYYRYDTGHLPKFPGAEDFGGVLVHPQDWPEDLDWTGKRVVVIGSGATAVTIVPAMAKRAAHVTMLQRTPTYMIAVPAIDPIHRWTKRLLGPVRAHRLARWMNLRVDRAVFDLSRRFPRQVRKLIRSHNIKQLPEGFDVDTHFNPPYNPWEQRMCAVLDGDLFHAIHEGSVSVATDHIARFDATGIELESGDRLDADLIVTATGIEMVPLAGIDYEVDGTSVSIADSITYKGMMLTTLPNFAYAMGYANASWTLKVDLICEHFCRLLALADERGYDYVLPEAPPAEDDTATLLDFSSGYVQRAIDRFPKQGSIEPWQLNMHYLNDRRLLREGPVGDHLRFFRTRARPVPLEAAAESKS